MSFTITETDIPPFLMKILQTIQDKKQIDNQELRQLLYSMRTKEEDVDELIDWMKKRNLITVRKGQNEFTIKVTNIILHYKNKETTVTP